MTDGNLEDRRRLRGLDREALARHQLERLNALLAAILPHNRFYAQKLAGIRLPLESLDRLKELPCTVKDELAGGDDASLAANLTWPVDRYVRLHRTSGTRGRPLAVLDTAEDWTWWLGVWQSIFDAAEVETTDRAFLAFSFGPFVGFWSAFDALVARGCLVIPGGGMSTLSRLDLIRTLKATVVLCTPSYALHMAEAAANENLDLATMFVRRLIVAGEPGGSSPTVRSRIEKAWNAKVIDHAGATEIGPWGVADRQRLGLHVLEHEFLAEFQSIETGELTCEGELSELILTSLGRIGAPVIRYRTGDLVRPRWTASSESSFVLLEGGVLGRVDDMMIVRGVNVFPSSIEQILHGFPEVVEHRLTVRKAGEMDVLSVEVEDGMEAPERIARELQVRLGLRVDVQCVPIGSLPRFEGKGKRFVDLRQAKQGQ